MKMIKYRIDFKSARGKYYSNEMEFNDERHFNNYVNKMSKDESKLKIIGMERIYGAEKEYTANDLQAAFNSGKSGKFNNFKEFCNNYFKRDIV